MDIKFKCPCCYHPLIVSNEGAGQSIKCPKCDNTIVVPKRSDPEPIPASLFKCPDCSSPISLKAISCPKCGCPISLGQQDASAKKNIDGNFGLIFVVMVAILIVILFRGCR
jgi:hypothetical protein